jgi:hypothetical protein
MAEVLDNLVGHFFQNLLGEPVGRLSVGTKWNKLKHIGKID